MGFSVYDASVPVFSAMLANLASVLEKGEENAISRKIEPSVFLNARLAPDMLNLTKQVQIATDHAKGCVARLAGIEVPKFEDNEQSFEELRARIAKIIAFVESVPAAHIDGSEERDISLKAGGKEMSFKGLPYLLGYALPNFYFHLVTAYNILRHNGVEIGKRDYIGTP